MIDDDPSLGFRFDGFLEDVVQSEPGESPLALLGDTSRVLRTIEQTGVSSVIIAATAIDVGTSNRLIRALSEYGVHVELSSTLCDIAAHRLTVRPVGRVPMMYIEPVQRSGWRQRAKRLFDLLSAALLLIPGIPVMMLAAVAIKLTSPGSVLFRQVRVGRDGELFEILKMRTMVQDAEARLGEIAHLNESTGPLFKVREDPRITRVGKLLRKLSIDELPQLINVVRGDMSLVGPRPALPGEVENWDAALHNRLRVQPGITGMWQVMGRSDGDHDSRYAQLDLYYVDNWSLVTDLVIVARTIPVVIGRKGQH
jgi:exopolysaccharide biosynthesis polyprenyl glycosylphosphotransferase